FRLAASAMISEPVSARTGATVRTSTMVSARRSTAPSTTSNPTPSNWPGCTSRLASERAPVRLRARRGDAPEVLAERRHRTEPDRRRDALDGMGGRLEEKLRAAHAGPVHPLERRGAGLLAKPTVQVPDAHRGAPRDPGEREVLVQVLFEPAEHPRQRRAIRGGRRVDDELRLAAFALERHDGQPGRFGGDGGAVVAAYHVEAEVEGGRRPGRREHPALVDVQDVRVHADPRMATRE